MALARSLKRRVRGLLNAAGYTIPCIAKKRHLAVRRTREEWRWLATLDIRTLVDVGANTGQFALRYLQQRPESLVYCFEPLEDCFLELRRQMAGVRGFTAFNVALGDSEGEADFYRSEFSPSSSLLPMAQTHKELYPFTSGITFETATVRKLDSYRDNITIRGGLLIKIDVQGAEARVLRGGPSLLDRADAVIVEVGYVGLYEGQAAIEDIITVLADHGLRFMGFVDQGVRPSDSLPVYGDVLFVRPESLPQNV